MFEPTKYSKVAVLLHWLIAIGVFFMFALGWFMVDLPREAPKQSSYDIFELGIYTLELGKELSPRSFYFNLHKSIGVLLFGLIMLRLFWRIITRPPAMLNTYKAWEVKLATAAHHLLYLLMLAIPITGILMATSSKYGLKWFGIKIIAGLDNKEMRDIFLGAHEFTGTLILVVLALHIAGALKHKFIDGDETMSRMTF